MSQYILNNNSNVKFTVLRAFSLGQNPDKPEGLENTIIYNQILDDKGPVFKLCLQAPYLQWYSMYLRLLCLYRFSFFLYREKAVAIVGCRSDV